MSDNLPWKNLKTDKCNHGQHRSGTKRQQVGIAYAAVFFSTVVKSDNRLCSL